MPEAIFTPEQLAEVKAYALPHYVWVGVGDYVHLAVYLLLLRFALPPLWRLAGRAADAIAARACLPRFSRAMERLWGRPGWGRSLLFVLAYAAVVELLFLPVAVYFGYFLERAHGQLNYTAPAYAWQQLKVEGVYLLLVAALTLGIGGLAPRLKAWWWILGTILALASLGSAVADPYRSQLYFEQTSLPQGPLRSQLEALLARARVEFADIVVEKTSKASKKVDVSCAGQGPTRRVILTDEFLAQFPDQEVLAAVAHEAGHVHQSNRLAMAASAAATFGFLFLVHLIFRRSVRRGWWGIQEYADARALPVVFLAFFVLASLATPISGAFSREREWDADRFAVALTQDPGAFESMLIRATRINKADPDPPAWVVWSGVRHPPMGERIAWAEAQKNAAGR